MKPKIRTPYFEIGVKNYVYGDDVLKMALHADACAEKYNVDVAMIVPYTELRRVCEQTKHLYVLSLIHIYVTVRLTSPGFSGFGGRRLLSHTCV